MFPPRVGPAHPNCLVSSLLRAQAGLVEKLLPKRELRQEGHG